MYQERTNETLRYNNYWRGIGWIDGCACSDGAWRKRVADRQRKIGGRLFALWLRAKQELDSRGEGGAAGQRCRQAGTEASQSRRGYGKSIRVRAGCDPPGRRS